MALLTPLGTDEAQALLARYDLGALAGLRPLVAGTVNSNFEVLTSLDKRVFLRLYEEQGRDGAEREARILAHLAARGVPTPSPIAMRDGGCVADVAGKPAVLFPWVEGSPRCQAAVTPGDTRRIGAALAGVHRAGQGLEPVPGRFDASDLFVRLERIAAAPQPELAAQAAPLRASLETWNRRRDRSLPAGLVHGDLFRDNVLWQQDGVAALLDFESACDGPYAYDLMVTVLSWCVGDALDARLARALVEGYTSVRPLAEPERAGLLAEGCAVALRFTITRITDRAMRGLTGIKDWRRFQMRLATLEQLGERGLRELLGA